MGRKGRSKNGESCFHAYSDKCARFRNKMVLVLRWLLKLNVLVRLHAFVLWTAACFAITSFIILLRVQIASDGFHYYRSMLSELCYSFIDFIEFVTIYT